jgi:hypothetical protein
MNTCLVCNRLTATQELLPDTIIPILGIIESAHGWVAHSDCMFPFTTAS